VRDGEGKEMYTYSLSDAKNAPVTMKMAPLEKQSPWESRRAWKDVADPLRQGDFGKALNAKSKLENGQREMRKKEKAEGRSWEQAFFSKVEEEKERDMLAILVESVGKEELRNILGTECWRYDADKARRWRDGEILRPKGPC
jgi:oxysterol-binding protein-related protein 9/10/11